MVFRFSNSRKAPYFHNSSTGESVWDPPAGLSQGEIMQLPGAEKYLGKGTAQERSGPTYAPPGQVRASHLLVKHSGSRRPASWKEANITRSKEEAIATLRDFQSQLDGTPGTFAQLANIHSDCSSHDRGGDLGWFSRGQMQKPFEDATYALKVGETSDIISTDSGVHLIMRTG
ncbi:rotamase-domain-containing protein [Sistotremastrum suecicum HHB10207 ss-3]|uniref:Peptidyl-prolyl cis-trans isomerase n=1 Tax=Sistotremastrum suecicum HHB10207 ss-3 TaxID=1314776 RepID=A0A166J1I9_9AGAM|nr:rotamase-domain-containing protein [Sistotremastrum suecicum HHB10207 ss-3]